MAFVQRKAGKITGVFSVRQPGFAEEYLPDNHPDVVALRDASTLVPEIVSSQQFARGLWKKNLINLDEAKSFIKTGTLPAQLQSLVNSLPVDERNDAELLIAGAGEFKRNHPLTPVLTAAFGWSTAQTDEFWRFCSSL